jgi:uncharacterized protein
VSIERRVASSRITLRAASADGPSVIEGLGAVYNSETVIGGWFRERIAPGAFASAIGSTSDVRSLLNHDPNRVLGRTAAGTMRLIDSDEGLRYEVDINPNDAEACSTAAKIARGDISGSSFGFTVAMDGDDWDDSEADKLPLRTIRAIRELFDVGPVTYPAYAEATSEARDHARALQTARESRDVPANVSTKKADPATSWSAPTLADFTKDAWGDLTKVEQNHIAGHYAWRAGETFGDLHLPHHRPSDGSIVLRGVIAAAGRLDQLAGGDKAAIRAHLEAHYHAFDLKAPWEDDSKAMQALIERRLRETDDDRHRLLRFAHATAK